MSIFRTIEYPDRPYYATRDFVLRGYRARRKVALLFALVLSVVLLIILILNGSVQSAFSEGIVAGGMALFLLLIASFIVVLLINRFSSMLNHALVGREHVEGCTEYLSRYDEDTLYTIEKMAQNDASGTQISSNLGNLALGVGIGVLLSSNLLTTEFAIPIVLFVGLVLPLIFLDNSERDGASVVIRQAVALRLDTLEHEKSGLPASEVAPDDKKRRLSAV